MALLDWQKAKIVLGYGGESWPEAFDSIDIACLSCEPEVGARAIIAALRDARASGGWCVRDSNLSGTWRIDRHTDDGPASYVCWRRGTEVHFIEFVRGREAQRTARRMHTAADVSDFYHAHKSEPPGLLRAWIAESAAPSGAAAAEAPREESSAEPPGVTRAEIIEGFRLRPEWDERLKKATAGRYAPLDGVWTVIGKQGGSPTLYSPARVGYALMTKYRNECDRPLRNEIAVSTTLKRVWPEWLDEWDKLRGIDTDAQ